MTQPLQRGLGIPVDGKQMPGDGTAVRTGEEIAALMAEGLSNRAIAQALVISPRTVDGHVEHIRSKLGFVSRAQIASWAARETVPT